MEIRALSKSAYQGFAFDVVYETQQYYDVVLQDRGFQLILKKFCRPVQKHWSDSLFGSWLEDPVAFGAFEGDTLLGFVEGSKEEWHNLFRVSNLFVYGPYRGQGIGETLLHHMVTYAKQQNTYRGIILETQTCNFAAISLYEKLGFQLCRIDSKEYTNQDVEHYEVRIDLFLNLQRYPCPCCGYGTYPVPAQDAIAYICPVCFWENDVFLSSEDEPSDENHGISLRNARKNFLKFGACDRKMLPHVREPLPEEILP